MTNMLNVTSSNQRQVVGFNSLSHLVETALITPIKQNISGLSTSDIYDKVIRYLEQEELGHHSVTINEIISQLEGVLTEIDISHINKLAKAICWLKVDYLFKYGDALAKDLGFIQNEINKIFTNDNKDKIKLEILKRLEKDCNDKKFAQLHDWFLQQGKLGLVHRLGTALGNGLATVERALGLDEESYQRSLKEQSFTDDANAIRQAGYWDSDMCDYIIPTLVRLADWPQGKGLCVVQDGRCRRYIFNKESALFEDEAMPPTRGDVVLLRTTKYSVAHYELVSEYSLSRTKVQVQKKVAVPSDGDCLFHAVLSGMGVIDTPENIIEWRSKVADYLLVRRDLYEPSYTSNSYGEYDEAIVRNKNLLTKEMLAKPSQKLLGELTALRAFGHINKKWELYSDILESIAKLYSINLCVVDGGSYTRYTHDGQVIHGDQAISGDVVLLLKDSKSIASYDLVTNYNIIDNDIKINEVQRFSSGACNLFSIIEQVLKSSKLEALRGKSSRDICTEVADFLLARIDAIGKFTPRPDHSKWSFGTAYYATGMLLGAAHNLTLHDMPPQKAFVHINEPESSSNSADNVPLQPPANSVSEGVLSCLALSTVAAAIVNPVAGLAVGVTCLATPAEAPANEMHVGNRGGTIEDSEEEYSDDIIEEGLKTAIPEESELVGDSNATEENEANLSYEQIRDILQTGSNSRSRILVLEERLFNFEESEVAKPSAEDFVDNELIFRPRINQALYNQETGESLLKIDVFKKPNSVIGVGSDFRSNFVLYELQSDDTEVEVLSPSIGIVMRPDNNYGYITVHNLSPGTYIIRARDEQVDERIGTERFEILDSNDFVEESLEEVGAVNESSDSENDLLNFWQTSRDRLFERYSYARRIYMSFINILFEPEELELISMDRELRQKNNEFSGDSEALTRWMESGERAFRERMEQHILSVEQKARNYIRSGQQEFREYYSAYERMLSKFLSLPAGDYVGKAEITRRLIKLVAWKNSFSNMTQSERNDVVSGVMLTLPLQSQITLYRKYKLETTVGDIGEPDILNGLDELFAELDRSVLTRTQVSSTTPPVSSSALLTAITTMPLGESFTETLRYGKFIRRDDVSTKLSYARITRRFMEAISDISNHYPREIFSILRASFSELRGYYTTAAEDEFISLPSTISWIRTVLGRALPELLAVYVIDDSKRGTIENSMRSAFEAALNEIANLGNRFRNQYKDLPLMLQENIFNNPDVKKFIAIVESFRVNSVSNTLYSFVDNRVNQKTIENMIEAGRLFDLVKTYTDQVVAEYNTSQASISQPSTSPFTRRLNELIISLGQLHKQFSQLQLTESNDVASLIFEIQQLLNIREPSENEVEQFFNRSSFISKAALQRLELPITRHCNSSESYRRINGGLICAIELFRRQYPTSLSQSSITAFRRRHSELAETYNRLSEDSAKVSWMKIVINETLPELVYISEFYEDTDKRKTLQAIIDSVFSNGALGEVANLFYRFRNQYENLPSRLQASVLNNPDVQRFLAIVEYFKVNSSSGTLYSIANTTLNNNTVENMIEAGSLFKKITNYLEPLVITDTTSSTRPENQQTLSTVSVTATSAEPTSSTSPASQTTINWDTYNDAMYQLVSSAANDKQSNDTLAASRSMLNLPFYLVPRPENMQTPWVIRPRVFVDTPVNGINIDIFSARESGTTSQAGTTSQRGSASPITEFLLVERRGNQTAYLEVFRLPLARTGFNLKYQLPTPLVEPNASIYRVSVYKAGEIIDGTAILFQHVGNNQFKYLVETEASVSQPATTSPPTVNSDSSLAMQALSDLRLLESAQFDLKQALLDVVQAELEALYQTNPNLRRTSYKLTDSIQVSLLSVRNNWHYKTYTLLELLTNFIMLDILKNAQSYKMFGSTRETDSHGYYAISNQVADRKNLSCIIQAFAGSSYDQERERRLVSERAERIEAAMKHAFRSKQTNNLSLNPQLDSILVGILKNQAKKALDKPGITSEARNAIESFISGRPVEMFFVDGIIAREISEVHVPRPIASPSHRPRYDSHLIRAEPAFSGRASGLFAIRYHAANGEEKYVILSAFTNDIYNYVTHPGGFTIRSNWSVLKNIFLKHSFLYSASAINNADMTKPWADDLLDLRRVNTINELAAQLRQQDNAQIESNMDYLVITPEEIRQHRLGSGTDLDDLIWLIGTVATVSVNFIPGLGQIASAILSAFAAGTFTTIRGFVANNRINREGVLDSEADALYEKTTESIIFDAIIDSGLEAIPLVGVAARRVIKAAKKAHIKTTTKGIMRISDALSLPMAPLKNLGELANTNPIIFRAINAAGRDTKMIVSTVNQELVAKGFSPRTIFVRGKNGVDDHFATVVRVNDEDMVVDLRLNRISRSNRIEFRGTLNDWWNASGINKNNYDNYLMFNSVDEATQHQKLLNQLAIIERTPMLQERGKLLTRLLGLDPKRVWFNSPMGAASDSRGVISFFRFSQINDFINLNIDAYRVIGKKSLQDGVSYELSMMIAFEVVAGKNPQEVLTVFTRISKFTDSNPAKKILFDELGKLSKGGQHPGLQQIYQQDSISLQAVMDRVGSLRSSNVNSLPERMVVAITTDSYRTATGTTKHTIFVGKDASQFYYFDANYGLVTFDDIDDLIRHINRELSSNYGFKSESRFAIEAFGKDPNQVLRETPFAKVLSESELPQLEASRKFSSAPTETLPDEMQGWLSELRATTDANGATLDNLINAPAGKCEAAMAPVADFMRAKGMTNIQYRGMYIWSDGLDEMPSNHFVVVGTFNNEQYVFDITAAQFATLGMSSIDAPLLLPERAWAYKFNTATTTKLIKYQDYSTIADARRAFASTNIPVPAAKRFTNGIVLSEPRWYSKVKEIDPAVNKLVNLKASSCLGGGRVKRSPCQIVLESVCNSESKVNDFYNSEVFRPIKDKLRGIYRTRDYPYNEQLVKELLHKYGLAAQANNQVYKNMDVAKLEAYLHFDLSISAAQKKYMTLGGWKEAYLSESGSNTLNTANYWRRRGVLGGQTRASAADDAQLTMYYVVNKADINSLLHGDYSALSGELGDLKTATNKLASSDDNVLLQIKLKPGAHVELFTSKNVGIVTSGTNAEYVDAVINLRASPGNRVLTRVGNNQPGNGLIKIQVDDSVEGMSLHIDKGDIVASNKFKSFVSEITVVTDPLNKLFKNVVTYNFDNQLIMRYSINNWREVSMDGFVLIEKRTGHVSGVRTRGLSACSAVAVFTEEKIFFTHLAGSNPDYINKNFIASLERLSEQERSSARIVIYSPEIKNPLGGDKVINPEIYELRYDEEHFIVQEIAEHINQKCNIPKENAHGLYHYRGEHMFAIGFNEENNIILGEISGDL